ncbi:TMEM165/GDT1 family protein [Prochlorococcus sp. MIT 1223]|uniref:TMEM165/GDT1 family protein n=1 Tax=Prochlorococcus sp. MIT 1223 TaxID=3096217 RepID=UPI002A74ABB5|nr:TMEM165/GDT1 family protein [Prochlorococcus sp. MIT 1223]
MTKNNEDTSDLSETSKEKLSDGFFAIFTSTFISVFIAELGDKTQIATLLLSAKSGKPAVVFAGAALALISSTLFVVILGSWLSKKISQVRISFISSFIMMSLGLWFGFQSLQTYFSSN